jgi:hypothetical protein
MTRRDFLVGSAGVGLVVLGSGNLGPVSSDAEAAPLDLDLFAKGSPRAFFFRQSESDASTGELTYEEWEKRYLPLGGIVGKVLNEEHNYADRNNLQWFLDYKEAHPEKMVLLHYNGRGRWPMDEATTRFFSGHFLYYRGTRLTQPLEADLAANVLHVEDTSVLSLGRHSAEVADDVLIAAVGEDGKPRWEEAEHLRLQAIDTQNATISVERGAYGSAVLSFPAGSYLAAHVVTAGPRAAALWSYNISTECPRDEQGRTCGEVLAEYLGEKLGAGGELSSFDGITLDVFAFTLLGFPPKDVDVNADGTADGGIVGGVDTFSFGSLEFLEKLRAHLGPEKLILSDGQLTNRAQRGFGYLNGVESEGYSDIYDVELDHLSKGENVFSYWKKNSAAPSANYVNFKYHESGKLRPRNTFEEPNLSEDMSYQKTRLALASALFTDSAFTYSMQWSPPGVLWREGGVTVRVFDELWKGTEQVPNWLGQPLGEAVHMAPRKNPDLFEGRGRTWPDPFVGRFEGERVTFSRAGSERRPTMAVRYVGTHASRVALRRRWSFALPGIEVPRKDLFVFLRLRAEPLEGYPASIPRCVDVHAVPSGGIPDAANMEFTWAASGYFDASFFFQDVGPGNVDLRFEVEGGQPVYFETLRAHSGRNGRYREYEGGVVFANPSTRAYTFNVRRLFPGVRLRRLQGSENQDPLTNDGSLLGDTLTLSAKNALFVARSEA